MRDCCVGCLSLDRSLSLINGEPLNFFTQLHPSLMNSEQPFSLCWECLANIHRMLRFKKQVCIATDFLQGISAGFYAYDTILAKGRSLSSLKCTNLTYIDFSNTEKDNESQLAPLAFVKIEHLDEDDVDNENCEDSIENFDLAVSCADDSDKETKGDDSKAELADDPFTYEVPVKTQSKKSSKKRQKKLKLSELKKTGKRSSERITTRNVLTRLITRLDCPSKVKRKKSETDFSDSGSDYEETIKKSKRRGGKRREREGGVINNERVYKKLEGLGVEADKVELVLLTWDEVEKEKDKALQSEKFTRHDFKCHDCAVGFNHKSKLENHLKKHDESGGGIVCSVCRVVCRDAHALCAHRRRHRERWRCTACGELSSRAAVAADHYARRHGAAAATHACKICGHVADTLGRLRIHLKNHMERQKCELCGKTFRDRTSLRTHLFIHKGEKDYQCPRCDKKFLFKKSMEVHMVTHDAPAQLYCLQCNVNFKNQMSYYQHMKYNLKHVDPKKLKHACHLCDKKFLKASRLEEHQHAVHLKITPIKCTQPNCSFACSSRPVLRTHIRMIHKNHKAIRNHVCDTCGKAYTTKKTLEGHMRTHTGERPFKCKLCPSTFGYEAALYNHNKLVHLLKGRTRKLKQPPPHTVPATSWAMDLGVVPDNT